MDVIQFIQSVGFPIFIALLFYLDLRKVIKCNTSAINSLTSQQRELTEALKRG